MPIVPVQSVSFDAGELGPYMYGRTDTGKFGKGLQICENFIPLPQGPLLRRKGFEFVADLTSDMPTGDVRLTMFDFQNVQQLELVFTDLKMKVFLNKALQATVVTPWTASQVASLRFAQSGDSLIAVHKDVPVQLIQIRGSALNWTVTPYSFTTLPQFRFNTTQTLTPSAVTAGGNITITLSGTVGYWTAGHFTSNVIVTVNGGTSQITSPKQDATGGTALASAGTAANAFDANAGTICLGGASGWIGYNYGSAKMTRVVALKMNTTGTYAFSFETGTDDTFSTPTVVGTVPAATLTAGQWTYIDVPYHTAAQRFRVRCTNGSAMDVQDAIFNLGLVANSTNGGTALSSTNADPAWKEQAFGEHKGYPRSVTFLANRLVFGGTRDEAAVVFGSKDGGINDFGYSAGPSPLTKDIVATDGFSFKIASDQNIIIRDMRSSRNGVAIFTSSGEYEMSGNGEAISPLNVNILKQTANGILQNIPIEEVDGSLVFIDRSAKTTRSFSYSFARDQYLADSLTLTAHHLFKQEDKPTGMTLLKNYSDTQSNLLFIPRQSGDIAVATIDDKNEVLGWSRFVAGSDGKFIAVSVAETTHITAYGPIPTLYAVIKITIMGNVKYYLCAMTEEQVFMDCFFLGSVPGGAQAWMGLSALAGEQIQIIGDGVVLAEEIVSNTGTFFTETSVVDVAVGVGYTSYALTLPLAVEVYRGVLKGSKIALKKAVIEVSRAFMLTVNNYAQSFRNFATELLDSPLSSFTGQKEVKINNIGDGHQSSPVVQLVVDQPVSCCIVGMTIFCKVPRGAK
ncbi:hypothetical protein [Dongia sp.]|uniref:hypothetical protein n=1 Tax=Dongia sp. TaxID=1977262 RepID=UPI0035B23F51